MRRATVLLATFQGARHLPAQLGSLAAQEGVAVRILASDDGSTDGTPAILARFAAQHGILAAQHDGPRRGAAANFLHLLSLAEPDGGLLAFCDQDDLWRPGKLARAGAMLEGAEGPALWIGRVSVCDEALARCRPAPVARDPSFGHALAEALGPGHAMVANAAAWALLHAAARAGEARGVPHHDWWATQMILGAGGRAILDTLPTTLYRQHGRNALGSGHGPAQALRAPLRMLRGDFGRDARAQRAALARSAHRLTAEARAALAALDALPARPPLARLRAVRAAGVRRGGRAAQAGLLLLAALGRL